MTKLIGREHSRRTFLKGGGALVVGFAFAGAGLAGKAQAGAFPIVDAGRLDSWLSIDKDGKVTLRTGRVDQGQGKSTAYGQIVADELDVRFEDVKVIMGDTGLTPNQGKSTATDGIKTGALPVRNAAAQARATLLGLAATSLGIPASQLSVTDGVVSGGGRSVSYADLVGGRLFNVTMTVTGPTAYNGQSTNVNVVPSGPLKDPARYKVVGTSVPRVDIPAKVTGTYVYTQNVSVPGMVHARIVLPPFVGSYPKMVPQLVSAKLKSGAPAGVQLVVKGNLVAVVAKEEWRAIQAQTMVDAKWIEDTSVRNLASYSKALRNSPNNEFNLVDSVTTRGNVDQAFAAGKTVSARYDYPQQIHGLIGPSVAVASYDKAKGSMLIWAGSQNLVQTRADVAQMLGMSLDDIRVLYTEQSSMFGRGGVDDVAPAAALLSRELGVPVRVQWMRQDEHSWSPHQPGRTHDMQGAVDASGKITAWAEESWGIRARWDQGWPLPWILLGTAKPVDAGSSGATGAPSYVIANQRVVGHSVDPLTRPMYMRTVAGTQQTFIQESFMDELAAAANADPIEFRIKHLDPVAATTARTLAVIQDVQRKSGWQTRPSPASAQTGDVVKGRGIAISPSAACCVANIAEVEVNRKTGVVRVTRFFSTVDLGTTLVNPDGVENQLQGGSLMGMSRALKEETRFSKNGVRSHDWVTYPIMRFKDLPDKLDLTVLISPASVPGGGIGEPSSIAVPAAIGNAIFDATGVRMRSVPFTPARVRAALKARA